MSFKKTCSQCGREVAESSKAGDRCPHCGVYWSDEREFKPIPVYEPSEENIRRKLWKEIKLKIGDKIPESEKNALAELAMEGRIKYLDHHDKDESYFMIEDGHVTALHIYGLREFHEKLFNLIGLKRFDLHIGTMPVIPDRMDEFQELSHISMVFTELKAFPESFGKMPNLRSLIITYGSIPKFPSNFGQFTNLRELVIDTPEIDIQNISTIFGNIHSLEIFKMRRVFLNFLPDRMRNHQKLIVLAVYENEGPLELEDGFCDLTELQMFNCFDTPLKNLSKIGKEFIKTLKKSKRFSKKDSWDEISLKTLEE
jgi:hypothetical protein